MKNAAVFFIVSLMAVSCASTDTQNKKESVVNQNLGREYLQELTPSSSRLQENRGGCRRSGATIKGMTWRQMIVEVNSCVVNKQWATVETLGNQMALQEPLSPWGAYYMSLAAESRKELPRAMWMIELALKKAPQSAILTYQQGRLQWLGGEQSAAQKTLKRALDLDKRLVDAQLLLGQLAMIANNDSEASDRFKAALTIEPRYLPALLAWAEACLRLKDLKTAHEALSQAIFHYPASYQARLRQAQIFERHDKNFAEALTAYKRLKTLEHERKLDALVDLDLDAKIRELENAVKQTPATQLSLREPAERKKEEKQ